MVFEALQGHFRAMEHLTRPFLSPPRLEVPVLSFAPPNLLGALRDPEVSPQFGAWPVSPQPSPALSYRSLRPSPQSRLLSAQSTPQLPRRELRLPRDLDSSAAPPSPRLVPAPRPLLPGPIFLEMPPMTAVSPPQTHRKLAHSGSLPIHFPGQALGPILAPTSPPASLRATAPCIDTSRRPLSPDRRALSPAPGARSPPFPSHRDPVPIPPPAEAVRQPPNTAPCAASPPWPSHGGACQVQYPAEPVGRALSPAPGARSPPLPSHRDPVPMPPPAEAVRQPPNTAPCAASPPWPSHGGACQVQYPAEPVGRALSPAPGARSPPLPSHRDPVPMPPPAEAVRRPCPPLPPQDPVPPPPEAAQGISVVEPVARPTIPVLARAPQNVAEGCSSPRFEDKGEDSLAQQLRALQEAKTSAAEQQAQSEQAILMRQGQLRRETFNVLRASGLTEALRRWPSPETPEQASPRKEPSLASVMEELPALSSLMEKTPQAERAEKEKPDGPAHERRKASSSRASRSRRLSASQSEARRCSKALAKVAAQMSTRQLRELRRLRLPAPVLQLLELLAQLLGEDPKVSPRKLCADSLPQRLANFDPATITAARRARVRFVLSSPELQHDAICELCPACSALSKWCDCIMVFLSRTEDLDSTELEYPSAGEEEAETEKLIVEPDLSSLSSSELAAVRELTVTKPGVGSVVFHGVTDCTDLDLHRDVFLKRGYVIVYPDQKKKPPLGHGLNKPATVTMYQCFPPGEPVRSEQAMKEYKERIRRMTEENSSCKFIDYDCETGVWQFDVTRF
ncbi:unnamed protein product [Effrenium voratum]|nr:unnamed protein product [Effrenium voratum]